MDIVSGWRLEAGRCKTSRGEYKGTKESDIVKLGDHRQPGLLGLGVCVTKGCGDSWDSYSGEDRGTKVRCVNLSVCWRDFRRCW